jgi:protein-tyrosine phosphatase
MASLAYRLPRLRRAWPAATASAVVAYLMARYGWTRDDALRFMRSRRDVVRPNPAFMRLLQEWEQAPK